MVFGRHLFWLVFGAAGCVGNIDERLTAPLPGQPPGPAVAPPMPPAPMASPPPACPAPAPSPSIMRRLTVAEHARALRDLFGSAAPPLGSIDLPVETFQDGYDGYGEAQSFTSAHLRGFRGAARTVVSKLAADEGSRDKILGCRVAGPEAEACLKTLVPRLGRRIFRRPLTDEEVNAYTALASGMDPGAGALAVVEAMLTSPHFLFLVEAGKPAAAPSVIRLDAYERASRLAFTLWGTIPDDRLLDDARDGVLDTRDGTLATVRRMLADPRAAEGTWAFMQRWLRIEPLARLPFEAEEAAILTPELRASMAEETRRLVASVTAPGAQLSDLLTTSHVTIDARLAQHYGAPRTSNMPDWQPQDLRPHQRGAGFLTQGAFLVVTAKTRITTPIRRAIYLREVLICRPPPPVPDVVPSIADVTLPKSSPVPALLEHHRRSPACAGCHSLLEPLGFGLESFGRVGQFRAKDEYGNAIDGKGILVESPTPEFTGPRELAERLLALPDFPTCVAKQMFRHAAGRHESESEACALQAVGKAAQAAGGSFASYVQALVTSDLLGQIGKEN